MAQTVPMENIGESANSLNTEEDEYSLTFFNKRSRVRHLNDEEKIVFYFDYKKPVANTGGESESLIGSNEIIDREVLRNLKQKNKWGVIRHPMVLNYINERLLDCALFYTLHILAFATFLLLLSSYIFSRTTIKDIVVTYFLLIFTSLMSLKVKSQMLQNRVSFWFMVASIFNSFTYLVTAVYVWFPMLSSFDDYNQETKRTTIWFLPIVTIISAWLNFLYVLRKSPYGIYIFMMVRILRSFGHISIIWISTLIVFSFAFHLIMRDSGIEPWESIDKYNNATLGTTFLVILQAITKTSSMMIGEVDANDILSKNVTNINEIPKWVPLILLLVFEIIIIILLMNLMVSLAVGDVNDLRNTAQEKLLRIKVGQPLFYWICEKVSAL